MKSVAIIANCQRTSAVECAAEVSGWLRHRGVQVRYGAELAGELGAGAEAAPDEELGRADLLVALGGDGTLLAANRFAAPHRTPILGVHIGGPASFGFLTEITPPQTREALQAILEGAYEVDERIMVAAEVERDGAHVATYNALNDIVIRAQARMLKMGVTVANTFIATYAADGILVATPTGSTAYNLAAGGPLVHPSIEALVLTPICPHTLNVRSLLVGVKDRIVIRMETGERDVTLLTSDGQISTQLLPQDQVTFRISELRGRFVALDGASFYTKVQTRLRLGERFGGESPV